MARKKQKSAKGGAPISSHPAFPAIVALWFAALFGIGSMVLPTSFFESVVTAIGLDAILPAAAPPLGFTARAAIAIAVSALGLAAGLFLARKVVAAQAEGQERSRGLKLKEEDRHPDAPAKRPISARRELGSEGLGPVDDPWKFEDEWADDEDQDEYEEEYDDDEGDDADDAEEDDLPQTTGRVAGRVAGRRRSLSVTDDSGPSEFLMNAPLPGQNPDDTLELDILELEPLEDEAVLETVEEAQAEPDNHVPVEVAEPVSAAQAFAMPDEIRAAPPEQHFAVPTQQDTATSEQEQPMTPIEPISAKPAAPVADTAPSTHALSDLGMAELVERFAKALQAKTSREEKAAQAGRQAHPVPQMMQADGANPFADRAAEVDLGEPAMAAPLPFTSPLSNHYEPSVQAAAASLGNAGTAGAAGAQDDTFAAPAAEEPAAPMVFRPAGSIEQADPGEPAPMPFAAEAQPAQTPFSPFGQPQGMPSALQPLGFDEDEDDDGEDAHAPLTIDFAAERKFAPPAADADDDGAAPFARPAAFGNPAASAQVFDGDGDEAGDEAGDEDSNDAYSSLLSMKSRLSGQEFARVDEDEAAAFAEPEPVVTFPGQTGAYPAEAAQPELARHQAPATPHDPARPFDGPKAPTRTSQPAHTVAAPQTPSDPSETERALREALEKLQRMSGAA